MIFPFGKYRGELLSDIPATYLCYALETFTNMSDELVMDCRIEIARRFELRPANYVPVEEVDLRVLIRQTYRELAKKYHPDKKGNTEAMQALNDYYQALTRQ